LKRADNLVQALRAVPTAGIMTQALQNVILERSPERVELAMEKLHALFLARAGHGFAVKGERQDAEESMLLLLSTIDKESHGVASNLFTSTVTETSQCSE
jgi:hypothetical protein